MRWRQQQISGPKREREANRYGRAKQRSSGASGTNKTKKAFALLTAKQVSHKRPEHRDRKQIEHANPNEEHACHDYRCDIGCYQHPKDCQIGYEEVIDDWDKPGSR
jgi:hypothetical protein